MPRQSVADLRLTRSTRYWPSRAGPSPTGKRFETKRKVRADDRDRAKRLLKACKTHERQLNVAAARRLAKRLDYLARGKGPPRSMASRSYMRIRRNAQGSQLYKLAEKDPSLVAFTAIKRGLEFAPDELLDVDPRPILEGFRQALHRQGSGQADGWLIAWLHGEYELPTGTFRLHIHGLATAGMSDVVSRLRATRPYRSTRGSSPGDGVFQRLRIERNLRHLPYPLTYGCKSYWPLKVVVDGDRGPRRSRGHRRIPEPHHSFVLLWLDKWRLSDITLLVHLSVEAGAFKVSAPK